MARTGRRLPFGFSSPAYSSPVCSPVTCSGLNSPSALHNKSQQQYKTIMKQRNIMKKRNNRHTPLPKEESPATPNSATPNNGFIPQEQIQKRAYAIFQTRGGAPGHELDDWLLAEAGLKTEIAPGPKDKS